MNARQVVGLALYGGLAGLGTVWAWAALAPTPLLVAGSLAGYSATVGVAMSHPLVLAAQHLLVPLQLFGQRVKGGFDRGCRDRALLLDGHLAGRQSLARHPESGAADDDAARRYSGRIAGVRPRV